MSPEFEPTKRNAGTAAEFFNSISDDYTESIARCVPRYSEMLQVLLTYVPDRFLNSPLEIVELGTGTGNLSLLLRERFPQANLQLVDFSVEALSICKSRIEIASANRSSEGLGRYSLIEKDFRELELAPESIDWFVSSIAIHHLDSVHKRKLFSKIRRWLKPNGLFSYADQFRGSNAAIYQIHQDAWRDHAQAVGVGEAEWESWMQHQQDHDFHDTLADQMSWLNEAGFQTIDCLWRNLLWTVIHAEPGEPSNPQ